MAENRYALIVANSRYDGRELRPLKAPDFDAAEVSKILSNPSIGDFKVGKVVNRNSHIVQQSIENFFADRAATDTLLLYFSGHGLRDDAGDLTLAVCNTSRKLLRSTGITHYFLRDVMKSCRAQRQVLILDCCFGGAMGKGLWKGEGDSVSATDLLEGQGRVILTASSAVEFALEEEGMKGEPQMSVFTKTLLSGLKSPDTDANRDGWISVQDIYNYTYKRMAIPGSKQTPTISSVGQEGEINLAKVVLSTATKSRTQAPISSGAHGRSRLDLRPWVQIRDQGGEGSNPALAAVVALETHQFALRGTVVRLSPRFVYQKAKLLDNIDPNRDSGLNVDTLIRVLEEFGVPPEKSWPYKAGRWQMPRGATWNSLEKLAEPYRARAFPVTDVDEIVVHLSKRRPILAYCKVYSSAWFNENVRQTGKIAKPKKLTGNPFGSIALTIVNFDEAQQVVHFAHTWGTSWGKRGFGEMTLDVAREILMGDQMWAIELRTGISFGWTKADESAHPETGVLKGGSPRAPRSRH